MRQELTGRRPLSPGKTDQSGKTQRKQHGIKQILGIYHRLQRGVHFLHATEREDVFARLDSEWQTE